jgi:uncharacterized iron-regulated protein
MPKRRWRTRFAPPTVTATKRASGVSIPTPRPGRLRPLLPLSRTLTGALWMLGALAMLAVSQASSARGEEPRLDEHPLVGHLWWVETGAPIARHEALARLVRADVLVLGETHGNPDHHTLQLEVLKALVEDGVRPTVAFEIFDLDDQARIDEIVRGPSPRADALAEAVGMSARGWDWPAYRPLVRFALDEGLPIVAANLSRRDAMAVAREGLSALPREDLVRLGLDRPLPEALRARMERRIVDAHCGHLPADRAGGMIDAQRARDALMADRLAAVDGPAVLITGTGHARLDYGVPYHLALRVPEREVVSVAFTEVRVGRETVTDYLEAGVSPFHLLWFTRRTSPDDPCAAFRRQLEEMRGRSRE